MRDRMRKKELAAAEQKAESFGFNAKNPLVSFVANKVIGKSKVEKEAARLQRLQQENAELQAKIQAKALEAENKKLKDQLGEGQSDDEEI